MMVPPLSESVAMVSPHNTGRQRHSQATTQPRLIKHKFFFVFCFFFWRGSASEDQTYRRPPVTHHHYISAQYHHIPEVTLSRGNERRTGKEGRRDVTLCNMFTTWEPLHPCTVPSVWLDNTPTGRESPMAKTWISTVWSEYTVNATSSMCAEHQRRKYEVKIAV